MDWNKYEIAFALIAVIFSGDGRAGGTYNTYRRFYQRPNCEHAAKMLKKANRRDEFYRRVEYRCIATLVKKDKKKE